ncbi:MAG TPA: sugar ABC transporter substrate-binding protein [Firmicutes bacterium]|nr:sugar ABC transporter substrate-binding protein [Bacillota bacterium]
MVSRQLTKLLYCVLLFALATGAAGAATEITYLTYSGHGAEWRIYLEEMAERFEARTGIKVNVMQVASGEYTPKVTSMIAGGVPPDVTDYHPAIAGALIGKGLFEDLRPYIERDKIPLDQIPPSTVAGLTTPDGAIWGLPWDTYPMVTFFNVDMFAQLGLVNPQQLGENWTLDQLATLSKRLTADTNGDGVNDRFGTYHLAWRWEMHVHQNGGVIWDQLVYPTKGIFTTPVVRQTVNFLADLMAVEKTNSESGSYTTWNGRVGMTLAYGPGVIETYLRKVSFNWGMAMQPKGSHSRAARVNPDSVQILAASKNKEAAWQWITFLVNNTEHQLEMTKMTGRLPAYREAMLQYNKVVPGLPSNWTVFVETAFDPASYSPYVVPQEGANDLVSSYMGKIWNGQLAPEVALEQLQAELDVIMAESF